MIDPKKPINIVGIVSIISGHINIQSDSFGCIKCLLSDPYDGFNEFCTLLFLIKFNLNEINSLWEGWYW